MPDKHLQTATVGGAPKRPRGRPTGVKTRLLGPAPALGVHHFAFLRSWFLQVDLREAWQRYMAFSDPGADLRHIEHRRRALLQQVLTAGQQLNRTLPPAQQLTRPLALLALPPSTRTGTTALPSLDEFAAQQGWEPDFYTQAELLQAFREVHHLDTVPEAAPAAAAGPGRDEQLRALHQIEALLARQPNVADPLDLWLSSALARLLSAVNVCTLGALADTVERDGPRWHARVPGLGATRARALAAWLAPLSERFDRPQAHPPATHLPTGTQGLVPVPLGLMAAPASGSTTACHPVAERPAGWPGPGGERAPPNGDPHDLAALRTWLQAHASAPATHRAYAKEAERFYLWCCLVAGKRLADLSADDVSDYRRFVASPPAHWINPRPATRTDPAWRPLRGPLGASALAYADRVVRTMLDDLAASGHVPTNPVRALPRAPRPAARHAAPGRALTASEWRFVKERLAALAAQAAKPGAGPVGRTGGHGVLAMAQLRRLQLLLDLLGQTGLRLSELAAATLSDLRCAPGRAGGQERWSLTVAGQGGPHRQVALAGAVVALVQQHQVDAAVAGPLPCPAPLICTLSPAPRRGAVDAQDRAATRAAAPAGPQALSSTGIYLTLKRFFRRIAVPADLPEGVSRERLLAASTHWLRHAVDHPAAGGHRPVPAPGPG